MVKSVARRISSVLDIIRPLWVGTMLGILTVLPPERLPLRSKMLVFWACSLLVLWLVAGWQSVWWRSTPFDIPWLIWLLLIPITLWATPVLQTTLKILRLFTAQTLAFWTMVVWTRSRQRAFWGVGGFLLIGLALALLGLFWMEWPTGYLFSVPSSLKKIREVCFLPIQEDINKNVLAGILVPIWNLSLGAFLATRGQWRWILRFLLLIVIFFLGSIILVAQSRGSWLAALAGLYILVSLYRSWAWSTGAGVLLLGGYLQMTHRLIPLLNSELAFRSGLSLMKRMELWTRAIYAIQDFAFTGIGMGAFPYVIPLLYPLFLYDPTEPIPHAHNIFLQVGVDLGLFGLIAFLSMILVTGELIRRSLARATEQNDESLVWLLRGSAAGLGAALIHGMVDAVTWNTRPSFIVWGLWGLTVGIALTLEVSPVWAKTSYD